MSREIPYYEQDQAITKEEYMKTYQTLNKHDIKKAEEKFNKFITNTDNTYYKIEIADTKFMCIFVRELMDSKFYDEFIDTIYSCVTEIKAIDFVDDNEDAMEVWGIDSNGEGKILYLLPYDAAVFKV